MTACLIWLCLENVLQMLGIVKNQGLDRLMAIVSAVFDYVMLVMLILCLVLYLATGSPDVASNVFNLSAMIYACAKSWHYKFTIATVTPICSFVATQIIAWNFVRNVRVQTITILLSYVFMMVFFLKDIILVNPEDICNYWKFMSSRQQVAYMYIYNIVIAVMFCASMVWHSYVHSKVKKFIEATLKFCNTCDVQPLEDLSKLSISWLKLDIECVIEALILRMRERNRYISEPYKLKRQEMQLDSQNYSDQSGSQNCGSSESGLVEIKPIKADYGQILICTVHLKKCTHSNDGNCDDCIKVLHRSLGTGTCGYTSRLCIHESIFHNVLWISANLVNRKMELEESIRVIVHSQQSRAIDGMELRVNMMYRSTTVSIIEHKGSSRFGIMDQKLLSDINYMSTVMKGSSLCILDDNVFKLLKSYKQYQLCQISHDQSESKKLYCVKITDDAKFEGEWLYTYRIANQKDITNICMSMWSDRMESKNRKKWLTWWRSDGSEINKTFGDDVMKNLDSMIRSWPEGISSSTSIIKVSQ